MAEDLNEIGTEATPPATPTESPEVIALKAQLEAQNTQLRALNDVVNSTLQARQVQSPGGDGTGITPQLRHMLRQKGLSDADINHNAPIILPFVEIFGPELVALVESRVSPIDEKVSLAEMVDDRDNFPFASGLKKEIREVIAEAKKRGQVMTPAVAYSTAVASNIEKVTKLQAKMVAESASSDASAMSGLSHRTSSGASSRGSRPAGPRTASDLASMSRDDRLKWYDANGDVPIQ